MWRIYSTPDPHRSPISRLLRHTRGWGGPILTRILTGPEIVSFRFSTYHLHRNNAFQGQYIWHTQCSEFQGQYISHTHTCVVIDWLIICCFTSRSRIFHLYGDATITGEGLQNLDLCSALRAFEQGGIFIVPHLLWHGPRSFRSHTKDRPHSVASYDTQGDVEDLEYCFSIYTLVVCVKIGPEIAGLHKERYCTLFSKKISYCL